MQALVVSLIVAAAAAYAAWILMPATLRRSLLGWLRHAAPARAQPLLARLDAEGTGCSTCKGCATDAGVHAPDMKTIELRRR